MHELNAVEAGVSPAILVVAAVYDRRSLPSREASMRDETLFRVTNSRYHANPSSDRVFFRRRCNDLTFPWRAVAHHWGEGGNESRQQARVSKVRTDPIFIFHFLINESCL